MRWIRGPSAMEGRCYRGEGVSHAFAGKKRDSLMCVYPPVSVCKCCPKAKACVYIVNQPIGHLHSHSKEGSSRDPNPTTTTSVPTSGCTPAACSAQRHRSLALRKSTSFGRRARAHARVKEHSSDGLILVYQSRSVRMTDREPA